jgi:DNA-binding MarR family transcriptional regulator
MVPYPRRRLRISLRETPPMRRQARVGLARMTFFLTLTSRHSTYNRLPVKATCPVPGSRYSALVQLLRATDSIWNASRIFFSRWELSTSQFNLLNLAADSREGLTQIDLSRRLLMHRSNLTGLVDRLEARRLVQRRASSRDRRTHRVVLTREGRMLLQQILPQYYAAAEEVWGEIPSRRATQLAAALSQVAANAGRVAKGFPRGKRASPREVKPESMTLAADQPRNK